MLCPHKAVVFPLVGPCVRCLLVICATRSTLLCSGPAKKDVNLEGAKKTILHTYGRGLSSASLSSLRRRNQAHFYLTQAPAGNNSAWGTCIVCYCVILSFCKMSPQPTFTWCQEVMVKNIVICLSPTPTQTKRQNPPADLKVIIVQYHPDTPTFIYAQCLK